MSLQISPKKSLFALALEAPGNLSRDLALYKRQLFVRFGAARGDASALSCPEISVLAVGSGRLRRKYLERDLAGCWKDIEGEFSSTDCFIEAGMLYLGIEGPWESLAKAATELLNDRLGDCDEAAVIQAVQLFPRKGFFLCAFDQAVLADLPEPPRLRFRDAGLIALSFSFGPETLQSASWRIIGRAKRRTGSSRTPSQRGARIGGQQDKPA